MMMDDEGERLKDAQVLFQMDLLIMLTNQNVYTYLSCAKL